MANATSGALRLGLSSAGRWTNGAVFQLLLGDSQLSRLLDTPVVLGLEFGAIGLAGVTGIVTCHRLGASRHQRRLAAGAAAILVLAVTVRPLPGEPNNVYARPLLVVWLVLAAFGACAWTRVPPRRIAGIVLLIGLLGTLYTPLGLFAEGAAFWATSRDAVAASRSLEGVTAPDTIVAVEPDRFATYAYFLPRPVYVADSRHARLFGASPSQHDEALRGLSDALEQDADDARRALASLGIGALVMERSRLPATWLASSCFALAHAGTAWVALIVEPAC